mgnify:CR=1 FL=1
MLMPEVKEKHPTWFKLKLERRKLISELPSDVAVNVLMACWSFLETGETPDAVGKYRVLGFLPRLRRKLAAVRAAGKKWCYRRQTAEGITIRYRMVPYGTVRHRNRYRDRDRLIIYIAFSSIGRTY